MLIYILSLIQIITFPFIVILPTNSLAYIFVLMLAGFAPIIKSVIQKDNSIFNIIVTAAGFGMLFIATLRIKEYVGL